LQASLTGGNRNDVTQLMPLIQDISPPVSTAMSQGIVTRLATLTTLAKARHASWCGGEDWIREEVPDEGDCGDR
jgi:hypothetical protein